MSFCFVPLFFVWCLHISMLCAFNWCSLLYILMLYNSKRNHCSPNYLMVKEIWGCQDLECCSCLTSRRRCSVRQLPQPPGVKRCFTRMPERRTFKHVQLSLLVERGTKSTHLSLCIYHISLCIYSLGCVYAARWGMCQALPPLLCWGAWC